MFPKLYTTRHPSAPYRVVYSDPQQRDNRGRPKKIVKSFAHLEPAEKYHKDLLKQAQYEGIAGLTFDAIARAEFTHAKQRLLEANVRATLPQVVDYYIRNHKAVSIEDIPIDACFREFLDKKAYEENLAARSVDNLKSRIRRWLDDAKIAFVHDIDDRTAQLVSKRHRLHHLNRPNSAQNRANDLSACSTFCDFLKAKGRLEENPFDQIARPKIDATRPRTLSAAQIRALLEKAGAMGNGRLLRYAVLAAFTFARPGEIERLDDASIQLAGRSPTVRFIGGKKRRQTRIVPLPPAAVAWLKVAPKVQPIWDINRDEALWADIRVAAGLAQFDPSSKSGRRLINSVWQGDILRHTGISNRLAQVKNENQVAREAANSPDVIYDHYFNLKTPAEMRAFYALRPSAELIARAHERVRGVRIPDRADGDRDRPVQPSQAVDWGEAARSGGQPEAARARPAAAQ